MEIFKASKIRCQFRLHHSSVLCLLLFVGLSLSQQPTIPTAEECLTSWACVWRNNSWGTPANGLCLYRSLAVDGTGQGTLAPPGRTRLSVTCDNDDQAPATIFQCLLVLSSAAKVTSLKLQNCNNLEIREGDLDPFEYLEELSTEWGFINKIESRAFCNAQKLRSINLSQQYTSQGMREYPHGLVGPREETNSSDPSSAEFLPNLRLLFLENFVFKTGIPDDAFVNLRGLTALAFLHCTFENSDFEKLTVLENLAYLIVSDTLAVDKIPKDVFSSLRSLIALELSMNLISRVEQDDLSSLTNLQHLSINANLVFIHPAAFQNLSNLITLDIKGNSLLGLRENIPSFTGIPQLQNLYLDRCYFSELSRYVFENITQVKTLSLAHNRLKKVPIIFANFVELPVKLINLENVDLSFNQISYILSYTFSYMPKLKVINLASNNISELAENTFFNLPLIEEIRLENNMIHSVHPIFLNAISSLETLSLQWNRLEHFPELRGANWVFGSNGLPSMPFQTYLEGNPLVCDCVMFHDLFVTDDSSGEWMLPYYASLIWPGDWKFSNQKFDRKRIKCNTEVAPDKLSIDAMMQAGSLINFFNVLDSVGECPSTCRCLYQCSSSQTFALCADVHLTEVPRNLSSNVTALYLRNNSISSLHRESFSHLPNLQYIDLSENIISDVEDATFYELRDLGTLYLNRNDLHEINPGMLNISSPNFVHLNLSSNRISLVEEKSFNNIQKMTLLELADNDLEVLPFGILDDLHNLSYLTVGGNPFNCSCDLLYLTNWYKDVVFVDDKELFTDINDINCSANFVNETELLGWIELQEAKCEVPPSYEPVTKIIGVTKFVLGPKQTDMLTLMVSISVAVALTTMVCFVVYRYRLEILVLLYVKTGLKPFNSKTDETGKLYDAFISFSSLDLEFVVQELLPRLESGENKRRFCIHHRDFTVGECIATNIINAIESSNKIVILCSKNYLASEWCSYEFKKAHQQALRDRTRRIVLIMMETIDKDYMDKEIKAYTSTKTYLDRKDALFWSKLEYSVPICKRPQCENNAAYINDGGHSVSESTSRV